MKRHVRIATSIQLANYSTISSENTSVYIDAEDATTGVYIAADATMITLGNGAFGEFSMRELYKVRNALIVNSNFAATGYGQHKDNGFDDASVASYSLAPDFESRIRYWLTFRAFKILSDKEILAEIDAISQQAGDSSRDVVLNSNYDFLSFRLARSKPNLISDEDWIMVCCLQCSQNPEQDCNWHLLEVLNAERYAIKTDLANLHRRSAQYSTMMREQKPACISNDVWWTVDPLTQLRIRVICARICSHNNRVGKDASGVRMRLLRSLLGCPDSYDGELGAIFKADVSVPFRPPTSPNSVDAFCHEPVTALPKPD